MDGILLVDKPVGWTSHDVVAKVRSILRQEISKQKLETSLIPNSELLVTPSPKVKVGHAGTLDPMATGLLIVLVGGYTKKAQEFLKMDKTYEAELTLGATSTTGDIEGEITPKIVRSDKKWEKIVRSHDFVTKITKVLKSFEGEIMQTPHQYSAVKVGGQRAYKAAREGKTVNIESRKVKIYEITDVKYNYPKLSFTTSVSSGTYIRSLAEDIGQKLGVGAYLSALRRTKVGKFRVEDAIDIGKLSLRTLIKHLQNRG